MLLPRPRSAATRHLHRLAHAPNQRRPRRRRLFVLPSLFILIALSWVYVRFGNQPLVAGLFFGLKPAVTALVLHAAHRIGTRALRNAWLWRPRAGVVRRDFLLHRAVPGHRGCRRPIGVVGSARRWPSGSRSGGACGRRAARYGPAIIDDDTPSPPHARFSRARLRGDPGGLVLWGAGVRGVHGGVGHGARPRWPLMGLVLHQGGARDVRRCVLRRAVLPYVYQGSRRDVHQWLRAADDRRARARRDDTGTIDHGRGVRRLRRRVVQQGAGPDAVLLGAALGAAVATFFTFLPSFVFIFAGGPLVEATHGKVGFTARYRRSRRPSSASWRISRCSSRGTCFGRTVSPGGSIGSRR